MLTFVRWIAFVSSVAIVLATTVRARAHDPFEITSDAHVDLSGLNVHTTLSLDSAARICLPGSDPERRFPVADFPRFRPQFERCAREFYALASGHERLPLLSVSLQVSPEGDLELRVSYARPKKSPLVFDALALKPLAPVAGVLLTVTGQRSFLGQKLLNPTDTRFELAITPEAEAIGTPPLPTAGAAQSAEGDRALRTLLACALLAGVAVALALASRRRRP